MSEDTSFPSWHIKRRDECYALNREISLDRKWEKFEEAQENFKRHERRFQQLEKDCLRATTYYDNKVNAMQAKLESDYEKKMRNERKSREKEFRALATEKVNEALAARNREIDAEIAKRVEQQLEARLKQCINDHEASSAIDVVVETEVANANSNRVARSALDTVMRQLTGDTNPPRHPSLVCVYCRDNEASVVWESCGHLATCVECAPRVWFSTDGKCQVCRCDIVNFRRLYF